MNKTLITFFTILFCLTSSVGWSLTWDDLVERNDIFYKKFTDVPFTGKTTGQVQGTFKNGKEDGSWTAYYVSGQLLFKGNWKNGKKDGSLFNYYQNGQLDSKGDYKNGKKEGSWVYYHDNGQLFSKGELKNGEKEGSWVTYRDNGQL